MSIRLMAKVWDLDLPTTEKLLLLALADMADDAGGNAWPKVALLARRTSISERQTRRTLRSLTEAGLISRELQAGCGVNGRIPKNYRPNVYTIHLDRGQAPPDGDNHDPPRGDISDSPRDDTHVSPGVSPVTALNRGRGDTGDRSRGDTSDSPRGDTGDRTGVTPVTPPIEPSLESPLDPSLEPPPPPRSVTPETAADEVTAAVVALSDEMVLRAGYPDQPAGSDLISWVDQARGRGWPTQDLLDAGTEVGAMDPSEIDKTALHVLRGAAKRMAKNDPPPERAERPTVPETDLDFTGMTGLPADPDDEIAQRYADDAGAST